MNSNAKTILGLLAIGAAGVAVGMLLAPEKGSDLRKNIKGQAGELGDKFSDLIAEGKEKLMGYAEDLKSRAGEIKKDAKTGVEHAKQAVS